jgi:spore maturation protein CgeB
MPDPDWARVMVFAGEGEDGVLRALDDARDADVIIKASGVGVFDELLEAAVADMKSLANVTIFWDVDAPATLDRVHHDAADPFAALIPRYDLVCTYGGGDAVVNAYHELGARACVPIYNAFDPDTHHPVAADPRFAADLGFLGNRLPDRERRVEQFFLDVAAAAPGRRFLLGGSGWAGKQRPENVSHVGHVYTRDHNAFNCTPLAVLNINRDSMARYGFSPPTRVFEAAGASACLITDAWDGIDAFLEPGQEVLVAHSGADVGAHLDALDSAAAARIGRAAYRRVLAHHTYAHRASLLESVLSGTAPVHPRVREIAP